MVEAARIRWGILGTAGIAESAFLPALRRTGDGDAIVVGSRDGAHAERWAAAQGVGRGVEGYAQVIADPQVEAVYIPLPNGLHAEWTIAALAAGKAVLCEKPFCATPQETEATLAAARGAAGPLWEAFVFPFHDQIEHAQAVIAGGEIGEVREIWSRFHFQLDDPDDIRLFAELAGGSIQDVGCYPIRLARLLFDGEPEPSRTLGDAVWIGTGVDSELWGTLTFAGDRRLDAVVRVPQPRGHVHAGTGHRGGDPDDEPLSPGARRLDDDPARRRSRGRPGRAGRRALVHARAPAYPPRPSGHGGPPPPRRGRGDGQCRGDR